MYKRQVSYDASVSICQYAVSFHMERRRYEYMVDAAFCKAVRVEVIEGSVDSITEIAFFVGIAQHAFAYKSIV